MWKNTKTQSCLTTLYLKILNGKSKRNKPTLFLGLIRVKFVRLYKMIEHIHSYHSEIHENKPLHEK